MYISQNVNQYYIVWTFYKGLYRQTLYEKHQHPAGAFLFVFFSVWKHIK
ncbi:hypothetical protein US8_01584 [Bacillus altitudinis]|nr:hypothetical protein US8_01584 [Bacillus altitudinis]